MGTVNQVIMRHIFFNIRSMILRFMSHYPGNTFVLMAMSNIPHTMENRIKLRDLNVNNQNRAHTSKVTSLKKENQVKQLELVHLNFNKCIRTLSKQWTSETYVGRLLKV